MRLPAFLIISKDREREREKEREREERERENEGAECKHCANRKKTGLVHIH